MTREEGEGNRRKKNKRGKRPNEAIPNLRKEINKKTLYTFVDFMMKNFENIER